MDRPRRLAVVHRRADSQSGALNLGVNDASLDFSVLCLVAVLAPFARSGSQTARTSMDTVRVGNLIAVLQPGVDTIETTFEARGPSGNMDKRTNVSVGASDSRNARRRSGASRAVWWRHAGSVFDFYLDPRTMATRRFEQHTPTDSAVTTLANGCVSGWVHLQKSERREIKCLPYADRFGGSPVDEGIVALLPLKANFEAALATYSPMTGVAAADVYTVRATDTIDVANRRIIAWRVERIIKSDYGTFTTNLWIDKERHRVVRVTRDFGNGRTSVSVLRNP